MPERMGVVGWGLMGAGIAEVSARAGLDVIVVESTDGAAAAGRARLEKSLQRAEEKGKIESAWAVLDRIRLSNDLGDVADRASRRSATSQRPADINLGPLGSVNGLSGDTGSNRLCTMLIGDYVEELSRSLSGPSRTKREMVAEVRDSLVDAAEALEAEGMLREEAERLVVAEFGDVREIAPAYQGELMACAGRRLGWVLMLAAPQTFLVWLLIWRLFPGDPANWADRPGWHAVVGEVMDMMQLGTGVLGALTLLWYRRRSHHVRMVARAVAIYVKALIPLTVMLCVPLVSRMEPMPGDTWVYLPWSVAAAITVALVAVQARYAGECLRLSRIATA